VSLTAAGLIEIMPNARRVAATYVEPLNQAMGAFGITTPRRQAAFLGQVAHESGQLQYTRELWGPTPAQVAYEGRHDLGNLEPGDGKRFLGRGLIQITGRLNYGEVSQALFGDDRLLITPTDLETPDLAALSAAWFWGKNGLNAWADANDYRTITRRINGGLNGWQDRVTYWERAKHLLGVQA
jgi:putative chitinase